MCFGDKELSSATSLSAQKSAIADLHVHSTRVFKAVLAETPIWYRESQSKPSRYQKSSAKAEHQVQYKRVQSLQVLIYTGRRNPLQLKQRYSCNAFSTGDLKDNARVSMYSGGSKNPLCTPSMNDCLVSRSKDFLHI